MDLFQKSIENEKKRYIEFIDCNNERNIFIYGAGRQAIPLAEFLKREGIAISGFCVTKKDNNRDYELGYKVYGIDELEYTNDSVCFISGVKPLLNEEIRKILLNHGYTKFLESTEYIRYIGEYGFYFYTNPVLEITTRLGCSINCRFCPQSTFITKYQEKKNVVNELSLDNFKNCIDKVPSNTIIEFAGFTEPFLNNDCIKMVEYANEAKHKLNMFTTLVGVNDEIVERIASIYFEEFVLHVPDEEGYSNITLDDNYLKKLDYFLNKKKPNTNTPFVDYVCSQGRIPNIIYERLQNKTRVYISLHDRAGNLEEENLYKKRNITNRIKCELSHNLDHNVLLPDGRVVLCPSDYGMKHVLGNLIDNSYDEIINGTEMKIIKKRMSEEKDDTILCRNCISAIEY